MEAQACGRSYYVSYLTLESTLRSKALGKDFKGSLSNRMVFRNWGCGDERPGPSLTELRVWGDPNILCLDKGEQEGRQVFVTFSDVCPDTLSAGEHSVW